MFRIICLYLDNKEYFERCLTSFYNTIILECVVRILRKYNNSFCRLLNIENYKIKFEQLIIEDAKSRFFERK